MKWTRNRPYNIVGQALILILYLQHLSFIIMYNIIMYNITVYFILYV